MAGIIDTIKLAGTLVLALPAAIAGVGFVRDGQAAIGITLIGLAIGLVVIQHWLTLPTDIPELLAKQFVGTIAKDPESDAEDER